MPEHGGRPTTASEAEAQADRQIEGLVAAGYLFRVTDPETGEPAYGATPRGLEWLATHDGWPSVPLPKPAGAPQHRRAHAAPRGRKFRPAALLVTLSAAIAVPAVTVAASQAVVQEDAPQEQGPILPKADPTDRVVKPDLKATLTTGPSEPDSRSQAKPKSSPPPTPTATPSPTVAAPVDGMQRKTHARADRHPEPHYIGRHRGEAAKETLADGDEAVRAVLLGEGGRVTMTIPGAGSGKAVSVQVSQPERDCDHSHTRAQDVREVEGYFGYDHSRSRGHHPQM